MDQRTIRYFLEVADCHSIRAASERLFIAGSAISRKISLLESQLGVQLFERTAQGMTLTTAGELYRQYAREALHSLEHIQAELDHVKGLTRGRVRVACLDGVISEFAIGAWSQFRSYFPDITLELRSCSADLVTVALHNREVDIGIGANAKREFGIEPVLTVSAHLFAVTAPGLMPASTKALKLRDVVGRYPIAIPDHNFVIRRQIDACVHSMQIAFAPALVTNSVEALRMFVRNCRAVTFLPMLAVREDLRTGRLVGIPMEDRILRDGTIDILVAANRELPPAAAEFVRCLTDLAQRVTIEELQH